MVEDAGDDGSSQRQRGARQARAQSAVNGGGGVAAGAGTTSTAGTAGGVTAQVGAAGVSAEEHGQQDQAGHVVEAGAGDLGEAGVGAGSDEFMAAVMRQLDRGPGAANQQHQQQLQQPQHLPPAARLAGGQAAGRRGLHPASPMQQASTPADTPTLAIGPGFADGMVVAPSSGATEMEMDRISVEGAAGSTHAVAGSPGRSRGVAAEAAAAGRQGAAVAAAAGSQRERPGPRRKRRQSSGAVREVMC